MLSAKLDSVGVSLSITGDCPTRKGQPRVVPRCSLRLLKASHSIALLQGAVMGHKVTFRTQQGGNRS